MDRGQRHSDEAPLPSKELFGGGVRDRDRSIAIDAENAGRHARQNRLDKGPPLVVQRIGLDEASLLAQQLGGHLVECLTEVAEVAVGGARGHLDVEIAGGHVVGCAN